MMILPLFLFIFSNLLIKVPQKPFNEVDQMLWFFVWSGKKPHTKLEILQVPIPDGGLALPHFKKYYQAAFFDWCTRFHTRRDLGSNCYLKQMLLESGSHLVPLIKILRLPNRSRYKTPQIIADSFLQLKQEYQYHFHPEMLISHSREIGLQVSQKSIVAWKRLGVLRFRDFLVGDQMKSWNQIKQSNPGLPSSLIFFFVFN